MSFLNGTVSCQRFSVDIANREPFSDDDTAALAKHNADARPLSDTEPPFGWCGGKHELDMDFRTERLLRGEYLTFGFRVTENKPPAGRIKALAELEVSGAEKDGRKLSWDDAMETARATVDEEGKDGRYTRHVVVPVVWDGTTGQVWYGSTSDKYVPLFQTLFHETFGVELSSINADSLTADEDPWENTYDPVWFPDSNNFIANDFLMWLLACDQAERYTVAGATFVVSKSVAVACPRGEDGRDTFTATCPAKVPELTTAIRKGLIARKVGLIVVPKEGHQYEFTLSDGWTVTGAKLGDADEDGDDVQAEVERLDRCRTLFRTIDAMLTEFVSQHAVNMSFVSQWTSEGSV